MSITLEEARKKLDILEKLVQDPKLILTDLFTEGVSGSNFLYQVSVNDKYILDYLREYLSSVPVFQDCVIKNSSSDFYISVEPLRIGKYAEYISNDIILKIDADEHTYKVIDRYINQYEQIMNKKYTLKLKELDDYWKIWDNLTFMKRVNNAFNALTSNKKLYTRLSDFIFWCVISDKKIKSKLDVIKEGINDTNEYNKNLYNEDIEHQKLYLKYAPEHIQRIKDKQKEIINYLISIGYEENNEMSEY